MSVSDVFTVTNTLNKTETISTADEVAVTMVYAVDVGFDNTINGSAMNALAIN